MSFSKNASRFDFLQDDAGDPFETASKKNRKKSSSSADKSQKGNLKKGGTTSDRKQLQSLAFGSASEGKKKNKGVSNSNQVLPQQNGNSSNNNSNGSSSSSKELNDPPEACALLEQKNGNPPGKLNLTQKPKGLSAEQWEQWQKRDTDIMDETYASDLQTALLQSKLDFDTEQKNKPPTGKGKKKKPVAVSLTDFNARLTEGASANATQSGVMNGGLNSISAAGSHNYQPPGGPYNNDEELVEKFRQEARLEIERERQLAIERQLLMSRQPPPPIARPTPIQLASAAAQGTSSSAVGSPSPTTSDEKDLLISRLTDDNSRMRGEIDLLKERVKAINNYLQAAHEVKDKAKLIYDLENMTKANNDLKEELCQVHSQLEQEKSRSSAAMLELRRLLENRRRTNTEGST